MTDAPEDRWAEVGRRITHRIDVELRLTNAEVQRRGNLSYKTLANYRAGKPIRRRDKERGLLRAVEWTSDSIERILRGEEPVVLSAGSSLGDAEVDRLRRRLEAGEQLSAEEERLLLLAAFDRIARLEATTERTEREPG